MKSIEFPNLYCPFESEIHQHVEAAQQHTEEWAIEFKLIDNDNVLQRFKEWKSAYFAARIFTRTNLERLFIAADWSSWLFFNDDQWDDTDLGKQPDKLRKSIDRLIAILYENRKITLENGTPIEASLCDLWERLKAKAPKGWEERYRRGVKDYLEALHWESLNRVNCKQPSVEKYMSMRPYAGAAETVLGLAEVTEDLNLSQQVLDNPIIQRLYYLSNVTASWSNDIFSYEKEKKHGDVHNLIIALEHERNLSYEEALEEAVNIHDRDVKEFVQLEKELPSFGEDMDRQVKKYVHVLRLLMRGHIDWSLIDTKRFEQEAI